MNIPLFDQTKLLKDDNSISLTTEAEAVRLSNELRPQPSRTIIAVRGERIDIPARQGFNCETCDFMTMVNWLADTRIEKSESLIAFVHRVMAVRFPDEYTQNKDKIQDRYQIEYEMIQSNAKNDISWLGEVGFQNMVRLDKSLNNVNTRIVKLKDDAFRIETI